MLTKEFGADKIIEDSRFESHTQSTHFLDDRKKQKGTARNEKSFTLRHFFDSRGLSKQETRNDECSSKATALEGSEIESTHSNDHWKHSQVISQNESGFLSKPTQKSALVLPHMKLLLRMNKNTSSTIICSKYLKAVNAINESVFRKAKKLSQF